ncbi:hypothetical protein [Streptomyces sp. NPDC060002]|uniref:hypothetical protein n=1 Tax=Streptomyces sp. NPDC060002 TaxID=3347033 RepID=UPI0036C8F7E0
MATYSADYLKRLLSAVERFEEVFERWMETQVESDHVQSHGMYPTVWTKEGQDQATVRTRELDVAEAAGAAERAVAVTGAKIAVAGVGVIDPIASWALMSAPRALVTPQLVFYRPNSNMASYLTRCQLFRGRGCGLGVILKIPRGKPG